MDITGIRARLRTTGIRVAGIAKIAEIAEIALIAGVTRAIETGTVTCRVRQGRGLR
jgi:hypothetical protein